MRAGVWSLGWGVAAVLALGALGALGAPAMAEPSAPQLELRARSAPDSRDRVLEVRPPRGWRFNPEAPARARLILELEAPRAQTVRGDAFQVLEARRARLEFSSRRPPSGRLRALICRPDRCRRLEAPVSWPPAR